MIYVIQNIEVFMLSLGIGAIVWVLVVRARDARIITAIKEEKEIDKDKLNKIVSPVYDVLSIFAFLTLSVFLLGFLLINSYSTENKIIVVSSIDKLEDGSVNEDSTIIDLSKDIDLKVFGEVFYLLKNNYPGFSEVSKEDLGYGVTRGLISAIGDPHTTFFDPERSSIYLDDVSGEFQGVGIEIGIREGRVQVISPIKDTPAYRAGVKAQDIIVAIDGDSAEGISLEEAVLRIRGPKGEPVVLSVVREGKVKEITIIRDTIKIASMEWELIEENIAYLKLFHFNENMRSDFQIASREIINSGADRIILDLRNNPGGILNVAVDIVGYFIENGEVAVIETDLKDEKNNNYMRTRRAPVLMDYDLVILINEGTASASEILAGALRDHRGDKVVGTKSFGKGSIQQIFNIENGSAVKITVRYFLTPDGHVIDEKGIKPDYLVEPKEDSEEDVQLQKAISLIKSIN